MKATNITAPIFNSIQFNSRRPNILHTAVSAIDPKSKRTTS